MGYERSYTQLYTLTKSHNLTFRKYVLQVVQLEYLSAQCIKEVKYGLHILKLNVPEVLINQLFLYI